MLKKLLFATALVIIASALNAQTIVWEENFEDTITLPTGWTQETAATDGGWKVGTAGSLSSSAFGIPDLGGNVACTNDDGCGATCNKSNDFLKTATIDLSAQAGNELYLLFDLFFFKATYQSKTESLEILASDDDGLSWTSFGFMPGAGNWAGRLIDVSAYAGKSTVQFGFKYNDGGGWLYGAAIDNLKIAIKDNIVRVASGSLRFSHYIPNIPGDIPAGTKALPGMELAVRGAMQNKGFPAITSFDATLTAGSQSYTKSFSGLNQTYGSTYNFDMDDPMSVLSGNNNVSLAISNINGGDDNDPSDNTTVVTVSGITPAPGHKVVGEEGTGTWCGWCPRGAVMMDYMTDAYPDVFIPIAVHNADLMKVTVYDAGVSAIIPGYPGGLIDRVHNIDPTEFEQYMFERLAETPKVLISQQVTFDSANRKAQVHSKLNFVEEMNGNYRIAVVFTENGVTGTASAYNQANYYSGGANGPMGGYESLPDPIPASQMVYNHVARSIVGGFKGAANSVPANNPAGSEHIHVSNYTIPAAYKVANMHVVTLLIDYVNNRIINAEQTIVPNVLVSSKEPENIVSAQLFPNPVRDAGTVKVYLAQTSDVKLRIVNAYGKVFHEYNYANISGEQRLPFHVGNLAAGAYMLVITSKAQTVMQPFMIVR